MRRALNVLQACYAAYDIVDESAVYNCTGNPHPGDIEDVVQSMMRDEFGTSYQCELAQGLFQILTAYFSCTGYS